MQRKRGLESQYAYLSLCDWRAAWATCLSVAGRLHARAVRPLGSVGCLSTWALCGRVSGWLLSLKAARNSRSQVWPNRCDQAAGGLGHLKWLTVCAQEQSG